MNANRQLLETLTRSEMFQDYERAYTETTGMPIALRPVETWQLPLHGKRGENPLCAMMVEKSRTCAACRSGGSVRCALAGQRRDVQACN